MATGIILVIGLAVVCVVGLNTYRQRSRSELLFSNEFAVGTSEDIVIRTLGAPDVDEPIDGANSRFVASRCSDKSARRLAYFTPGGGAYCYVYLDTSKRVTCIEHGLIAV